MKLKTLHIKGYKNLDDIEIDFTKSGRCSLIIGTNGCGKSNLLETLSAIFAACYNNDRNVLPDFRFELTYTIERMRTGSFAGGLLYRFPIDVCITNVGGKIEIKSFKAGTWLTIDQKDKFLFLPENVIAVYSGEEKRLWNTYFFDYYDKFNKQYIKTSSSAIPLRMVYIDKEYWDLIAATLASYNFERHDNFLQNINLDNIASIKCTFDTKKILGNKNEIAKLMLTRLNPDMKEQVELSVEKYQELKDDCGYEQDVFFNMAVLVLYKDYKIITDFQVICNNGRVIKDLSEGEKKLLLIYGALNIIEGENLVLLDEPDAHLHEGRKKEIYDLLTQESENQIIVASHSPKLIRLFPDDSQFMLRLNNGIVEELSNADFERLNEILDSDISFEEENAIKESRKPLLLVEGKTDKKHLENAWKILYDTADMPFVIINLNGTDRIRQYILGVPDKFATHPIVALVDNDNAGQSVCKGAISVDENVFKFNNDAEQQRQAYAITIPFQSEDIKKFNYCPIEFLYDYETLVKYDVIEKIDIRKAMRVWMQDGTDALKKDEYCVAENLCFYEVKDNEKNIFAESIIKDGIERSKLMRFEEVFRLVLRVLNNA